MTTKQDILKAAVDQREQEVLGYQINIDNYRLALARLDVLNDPDLNEFRNQLAGLLSTEIIEQKKAQVILDVVKQQLE